MCASGLFGVFGLFGVYSGGFGVYSGGFGDGLGPLVAFGDPHQGAAAGQRPAQVERLMPRACSGYSGFFGVFGWIRRWGGLLVAFGDPHQGAAAGQRTTQGGERL